MLIRSECKKEMRAAVWPFDDQNELFEQEKHILGGFMLYCLHAATVPIPQSFWDSLWFTVCDSLVF